MIILLSEGRKMSIQIRGNVEIYFSYDQDILFLFWAVTKMVLNENKNVGVYAFFKI
jgi:hypothetical protein